MSNISSRPNPTKSSVNSDALPPKPYTEYTIFFRLERAYILESSGIIDEETVASLKPNHHDVLEFPRPTKYQCLTMPPYWYSSSHKAAIEKKRKHRKRKGRMDLKTLSKTISASWRNADRAIVEYCRKLSKAESEKYNKLVEGILAKQEPDQTAKDDTTAAQQWNSTRQEGRLFKTTPCGSLSLQDFVVEPAIKVAAHVTPPITNSLASGSYNKLGSYGQINEGPNDSALLRMLRLQQLKAAHEKMTLSIVSSPLIPVLGPLFFSASGPSGPLPDKKRKFVCRALAPPDDCNTSSSSILGEDSCTQPQAAKRMRRTSSMPPSPRQGIQADLSASFQQEPRGSFTCVPEWEKDDADTLLGILNADPLQVESSGFSLGKNQYNDMSLGLCPLETNLGVSDTMCGFCLGW